MLALARTSYLFDASSIAIIAISLGMLAIGLWVWSRDIDDREHAEYGKVATILTGILLPVGLSLAAQSRELAFYWDSWSWAFVCVVPAAIFAFEATHLGLDRLRRLVLPLYAVGFAFAAAIPLGAFLDAEHTHVYVWGELQGLRPLGYVFFLYFICVFLFFLRLHDRKRRERGLPEALRRRYRLTFFGWVFGTFASLDFLGYFGLPWPPTSFIFFLLWTVIFAYGILKYRLFRVTEAIAAPAIVESMPSALFVANMAGEIVIVNPQASKLTRTASGEMIGRRVTEFIPMAAGLLVEAAEHPPIGPLRSESEAALKDAAGAEHPVALSAMPIFGEGGAPAGVTIIATDIGRLKEQVSIIEAQKAELETSVARMEKVQEQLVGRELKMIELKKELEALKKGK
ncbi:MAG TPA: histidine kinase N-terminal 7TM domain-containing protein [Candidatus Baltobacteraceae bacterium]|nr:histidine kinase N-terminal 7TM domain-containing protein [Candidatus Baltobacteraceae bacterium]